MKSAKRNITMLNELAKILPYSKGRSLQLLKYICESKLDWDLVLLYWKGKAIAGCDIFLTETEFLENLKYHFARYDFKPDLALLRKLESFGFLPQGGLLSTEHHLSSIPKCIDTTPAVFTPNDVKLLYDRYKSIIECHNQRKLMFEGSIELAGIAPNLISSSFIVKHQKDFPIRIYLYTQIKDLERFYFLAADRFLKGVSYYEDELAEFKKLVYAKNILEPQLQDFLEKNFWIWGFEYTQAIPKQTLGDKYEIDFLLKRIDGKWEIVEIERSNLPLFTKKLDLRKELSHAMGQVRDYQSYCMRNYSYLLSEDRLDMFVPKGYVIMGNKVSGAEKRKLDELNKGQTHLEVHTYEYLIERASRFAETLKSILGLTVRGADSASRA